MPWSTLEDVPSQVRKHRGAFLTLEQANWWGNRFDKLLESNVPRGEAAAITWTRFAERFVRQGDRWVRRTSAARAIIEARSSAADEGIPIPNRTHDPTGTEGIQRSWERKLVGAFRKFVLEVARFVRSQESLVATAERPIRGVLTADTLFFHLQTELQLLFDSQGELTEAQTKLFLDRGFSTADRKVDRLLKIDPSFGIAIAFDIPIPPSLQIALATATGELITKVGEDLRDRIMTTFREAVLAGEGPAGTARAIRDASGFALNRASMIARTEGIRAFSEGSLSRYADYGIERVMWLAALDERTDGTCEDLHGEIFPTPPSIEIPVHPRCRCAWEPIRPGRGNREREGTGPPVPATAQFFEL